MTLGHVCQRLGGSIDKAFIEREVLLRTDGRVLYAYLSRRTQLLLAGGLGIVAVCFVAGAFSLLGQNENPYLASDSDQARRSSSLSQVEQSQGSESTIQAPRGRIGDGSRPTIATRQFADSKLRRLGGDPEPRSARDLPQGVPAYGPPSQWTADFERGRQLAEAASRLEFELAMLHEALVTSSGDLDQIRRERDFLRARVTGLERRMTEMGQTQDAILDRLTEQITYSIETFEQVLSMTGANLSELIPEANTAPIELDQGGPFIPGDFLAEDRPGGSFMGTAALLKLQLDRFQGLQEVIRRVPLTAPLDHYKVVSGYGKRTDPVNGQISRHFGIDMKAPLGTPVMSAGPGKVVFAGWRGRYGRMVVIDHGQGFKTRYAHLRKILVKKDQEVTHRQKIGLLGSSGRSTGPHLHYEVHVKERAHNPLGFIKAGKYLFKDG